MSSRRRGRALRQRGGGNRNKRTPHVGAVGCRGAVASAASGSPLEWQRRKVRVCMDGDLEKGELDLSAKGW